MKQKQLAGTEITTSVLGFGCSALLGEKTKAEGLQLLEAAYGADIRYFDVAPMYGYGEAERLLGEFARNRRAELVIATKFGIEPRAPAVMNGSVRTLIRKAMTVSPKLRQFVSRKAVGAQKTGRFQPQSAAHSLERSLRALGTDYIDIYLLHECSLADTASDELLDFLEQNRSQGKIRYFGVGTRATEAALICKQRPEFAAIVQFGNSVLSRAAETIDAPGAMITHGALAGSYAALTTYLQERPEKEREWSDKIGADCSDGSVLAGIMLAYAMAANDRGPVLFQSRRAESIRQNVRMLESGQFSQSQIEEFGRLAAASQVQPV